MSAMARFRPRRQAGVGLVELMVTMLLGALITAGVISLFNANRQSFRLQDNISLAQEQGSFALEFISRDLRRAGYPGATNFVGGFDADFSLNDQVVTLPQTVGGATVSVDFVNDQLALIYEPNRFSAQTTCTGDPVPAGTALISNRYWLRPTADNSELELVCQGFAITASEGNITARDAIGQPQALISGVDSFQVLYGVDLTPSSLSACAPSARQPNLYVPGNVLAAAYAAVMAIPSTSCPTEFWVSRAQMVRSVRIALLMRTPVDVDAPERDDLRFTLLDRVLTEANFPIIADGRVRRVFMTTVAIRNSGGGQ